MKDSHGLPAGTRGPDRAARERLLTGRVGAGWENFQVHGLGRAGPKTFWILRAGPARAAIFHGLQCSTMYIKRNWYLVPSEQVPASKICMNFQVRFASLKLL